MLNKLNCVIEIELLYHPWVVCQFVFVNIVDIKDALTLEAHHI